MRGSSLVQATMIFFIGCLVLCAQCALDNKQTMVNQDDHAANTSTNATIINSTSVGESKKTEKFCSLFLICYLNIEIRAECYCCENKNADCYKTKTECLQKCHSYNG
ncbi:hypothetical protein CFC21_107183 [Triticum aestivum]|uniref:Uncharacterized protein n=2 Tax=Triticum aestivum TaxID=4565 RepID=A0A9R1NA72_WHEAT|nr:hypothetical protein CFC21_107183 [Triticum aestivum]